MRKLQRILALLLLCLFTLAPTTFARGTHASTHRTSQKRSHKRNNKPKTVHVRTYKRKDGTVVRAHDRSAPQR